MPGPGMFTKGPILHYVVIPQHNTSIAYFLGTDVSSPKERQEQYELPVMNDLGGRSVRFQSVNDGEEWKVYTTLNRFDMNVIRALRYLKSGVSFNVAGGGFPNPLAFAPTNPPLGTQNNLARGSLVIGAQDFQLILINSYAGTLAAGLPVAAAADLATARAWYTCSIAAYEEEQEATRVTEVSMVIECRNAFNPVNRYFGAYSEGTPTLTFVPPLAGPYN